MVLSSLLVRNSAFNIVGAGLLIVASTYGLSRYTYGLFVPAIRDDFNLSQTAVGAIGSASYLGYLLATGQGAVKKDEEAAATWFQRAGAA